LHEVVVQVGAAGNAEEKAGSSSSSSRRRRRRGTIDLGDVCITGWRGRIH